MTSADCRSSRRPSIADPAQLRPSLCFGQLQVLFLQMDRAFRYQVGRNFPVLFLKFYFGKGVVIGAQLEFDVAGVALLPGEVVEFLYGHPFPPFASRSRR